MNSRPHNLKSEQLENHLLREILPQYRPGERVPSEVEMARQLGTSRTTMHKVYFNLISRGLLYRQSGIGTFRADRAEEPALRMITAVMPSLKFRTVLSGKDLKPCSSNAFKITVLHPPFSDSPSAPALPSPPAVRRLFCFCPCRCR